MLFLNQIKKREVFKMTKFMWNGIKVEGKLYRAHYNKGCYTNLPKGTITIYMRDYVRTPKIEGLQVENDTDIMTDYFDKDSIRVTPDNVFYKEVEQAFLKHQEHYNKRFA